jgi:fumarate hydratase class I
VIEMRDLTQEFLELIRLTSTDLPSDIEKALKKAAENETPGTAAYGAMESILINVEITRRKSIPICQDTGTPIFFVSHPEGWNSRTLRSQIRAAIAEATRKTYLRPNAVEVTHGINTGDNMGDNNFPTIHFEDSDGDSLTINLMLKGGGGLDSTTILDIFFRVFIGVTEKVNKDFFGVFSNCWGWGLR